MTSHLEPPPQIRADVPAAATQRVARRRRLRIAVAAAVAVLGAAGTVAAGGMAGWFGGDEASFNSATTSPVEGAFLATIGCSLGADGTLACEPGSSEYEYHLKTRVQPNSAGSVGAGVVEPNGTKLHPPAGVPGWITCTEAASMLRCSAVAPDAALPPGAPIYALDFGAWTSG